MAACQNPPIIKKRKICRKDPRGDAFRQSMYYGIREELLKCGPIDSLFDCETLKTIYFKICSQFINSPSRPPSFFKDRICCYILSRLLDNHSFQDFTTLMGLLKLNYTYEQVFPRKSSRKNFSSSHSEKKKQRIFNTGRKKPGRKPNAEIHERETLAQLKDLFEIEISAMSCYSASFGIISASGMPLVTSAC